MNLVVVGFILEIADGLLPICRQDVAVIAIETLTDLQACQSTRPAYFPLLRGVHYISPRPCVEFRLCVTCVGRYLWRNQSVDGVRKVCGSYLGTRTCESSQSARRSSLACPIGRNDLP